MKRFNMSFRNDLHESMTLDQLIHHLRIWGVSMPAMIVMLIDSLDIDRWIARDYLYKITRVA